MARSIKMNYPSQILLPTLSRSHSQVPRNTESILFSISISLSLFHHLSKANKDTLNALICWVKSYTVSTNKYFRISHHLRPYHSLHPPTVRREVHIKLSGLRIMTSVHALPSLLPSICVWPRTADQDRLSSLI